jgi:hypothetical protein
MSMTRQSWTHANEGNEGIIESAFSTVKTGESAGDMLLRWSKNSSVRFLSPSAENQGLSLAFRPAQTQTYITQETHAAMLAVV